MNIKAFSKSIDMTDAISNYIQKKVLTLQRLLKNVPPETMIEVEVGKDHKKRKGEGFKAEIIIKLPDKRLYASVVDGDLYAAIDKVKDEVLSELKKNKNKKRDVKRDQAAKIKKEIKG